MGLRSWAAEKAPLTIVVPVDNRGQGMTLALAVGQLTVPALAGGPLVTDEVMRREQGGCSGRPHLVVRVDRIKVSYKTKGGPLGAAFR